MSDQKLRVRAAGDTLVPNLDVDPSHPHRFVGRTSSEPGKWAPNKDVTELPFRKEYVDALKAGELEAADDATRMLAGLPVDPEDRGDSDEPTDESGKADAKGAA